MASLIPGYEYDIFVSYRQKDNKGDGWVSEFIEALKTELESTFKEEISVYFDINPSDYLLESYDVDASLKDKLKCLIFIPIISRTYCDPKSFAWEHEFKAFVNQASQDQFGLKVKLPNGNVANRLLPVRIHDLDITDIKECESVLGGVLRGIEFIYKESGIDKPLAPEDDEKKNLNNTKYRIQIIKVAHAIKELISGLQTEPVELGKEKIQQKEPSKEVGIEERREVQEKPAKLKKGKLIPSVAVLAILIIAAIFAYPKIFKQDKLENLKSSDGRISVAIMPFQNMTNDTTWNIWQIGIQDILITSLSNSEELKVRQTESINSLIQNKGLDNYASITPSIASIVSQKLNANIFICGSIKQMGPTIRLNAQLIDSKTKEVFKSFQIEGNSEKIMPIIDSLSVQVKNFLIISKLLKEESPYDQKYMATITSPQAYKYVMDGEHAFAKMDYPTAISMFLQALAIDSTFVDPFLSITWAYLNQNLYDEAKKWCQKAYEKKNLMTRGMKIDADVLHAYLFGTDYEVIGRLRQQQDFDNQNPMVYNDLGGTYNRLSQYDKAIPEFEKSLEIYDKWGVKPWWVSPYAGLGAAYHKTGQYKKERELYKKAEKDFPDNILLIRGQAILSLTEGDSVAANRYIIKLKSIAKENYSSSEATLAAGLAGIYSGAGILDEAEKYYRQTLLLEPEIPNRLNNLAYFLIDKDRNIKEGMELVEKALQLRPDNYNYMHTKGWGLYKQGKYNEALEILQKSWDLRMKNAVYNHEASLHLEAAKKAVASQKNN